MSTRTFFRSTLLAVSALVVGMVLASRLGLSPASFAGTLTVPATNSAPLVGPLDASTFRTVAQQASPAVVSIRTTATRQGLGIDDLFGLDSFYSDIFFRVRTHISKNFNSTLTDGEMQGRVA